MKAFGDRGLIPNAVYIIHAKWKFKCSNFDLKYQTIDKLPDKQRQHKYLNGPLSRKRICAEVELDPALELYK